VLSGDDPFDEATMVDEHTPARSEVDVREGQREMAHT
jgi:hypothetical protein